MGNGKSASGRQSSVKLGTIKTIGDLVRLAAGEQSYYLGEEYQRNIKESSDAFNRMNELKSEIRELNDQLDGEILVDPELGRTYSKILGLYTEKGRQLNEQINEKRRELESVQGQWEAANERVKAADVAARERQAARFAATEPTPATQASYKGFEMDTHTPYLQEAFKSGRAYIAEMSPVEYLQRVSLQVFRRSSLESAIRGTSVDSVKKYAQMMRNGTDFFMPSLNLRDREQEGRHRALAALLNGYKKIPVMIVP